MNYLAIVRQQIMLWTTIVEDCLRLGKYEPAEEARKVLNYWISQIPSEVK